MWQRLRRWALVLVGQTPAQRAGREADVALDPHTPTPPAGDRSFVGRITGDDPAGRQGDPNP